MLHKVNLVLLVDAKTAQAAVEEIQEMIFQYNANVSSKIGLSDVTAIQAIDVEKLASQSIPHVNNTPYTSVRGELFATAMDNINEFERK